MVEIDGKNFAGERDLEKIARVFGAVDHWREVLSLPRGPREKSAYLQLTERLHRRMGEPSYSRSWKEGSSFSIERVLDEASALFKAPPRPEKNGRLSAEMDKIFAPLSERERQVIGLVAEGLTNQQIAVRLSITERTVRFHITSIFNKLGAENRAQVVAIAGRLGILLNPDRPV